MSPPTDAHPGQYEENLRFAYEQQLENLREAKRLQFQVTYLGVVALAGLAAASQLLHFGSPSVKRVAAFTLTILGAAAALAACRIVWKARRSMRECRGALEDLAGRLDDSARPYLTHLLGIEPDYGSQRDFEPFLLLAVLVVGAVILGTLLLKCPC